MLTRTFALSAQIDEFLTDFPNAFTRAVQLDQKILDAANAVSPAYADLVSIATRQAFSATELTISNGTDGQWNTTDVMMFMKNIGGDATKYVFTPPFFPFQLPLNVYGLSFWCCSRVNAVETLYSAWPMFMFVDPSLGALLLEPLLRFQASPAYLNPYAAPDIGMSYPARVVSG